MMTKPEQDDSKWLQGYRDLERLLLRESGGRHHLAALRAIAELDIKTIGHEPKTVEGILGFSWVVYHENPGNYPLDWRARRPAMVHTWLLIQRLEAEDLEAALK